MLHVSSPAAHSHHGHQPWEPSAVLIRLLWSPLFLLKDIPIQDTSLCLSPASCEMFFSQFPSLTDPGHYRAAASVEKPRSHARGSVWPGAFVRTAQGGGSHTVLGLWHSPAWAQWQPGTGHRAWWLHINSQHTWFTWWEHPKGIICL